MRLLLRREAPAAAGSAPRSRRRSRLALAPSLAAVLLLGGVAASADDDPGPGPWAGETAYRALGESAGLPGTWAYAREKWEEAGTTTEGAWLFVVRAPGAAELAYRVDADLGEGGAADLTLKVLDRDGDAAPAPVRVAVTSVEAGKDREAAARALVRDAAAAAADWAAAEATAVPAGKDDLDTERLRWRAVARALEGANERHPNHLGILRDLVVAYARLLPLTAETPTASTLAVLLPRRLADWEDAWDGREDAADARLLRRCRAALYLQTGPHALAEQAAAEDPEDPELARAHRVLLSLGYVAFEAVEAVDVAGAPLACEISGWKATGSPAVPGVLFDRRTFLVGPKEGRPFDTSYALSGRLAAGESGAVRWGLYGCFGGSRRLLRAYGTTEPDAAVVEKEVQALVAASLATVAAPPEQPK